MNRLKADLMAACRHSAADTLEMPGGEFYAIYVCQHPQRCPAGPRMCRLVRSTSCAHWQPYMGPESLVVGKG